MSGTTRGGRKTAVTNKERYGKDYYKGIGRLGGLMSTGGGFASEKIGPDGLSGSERSKIAGHKGGIAPRKPRILQTHCKRGHEYTKVNTYSPPGNPRSRQCRACTALRGL